MDEQCLGIDWGKARIGLALGNTQTKLASPLKAVASLSEIKKIVADEEIDRLVVGQPVNEQGGGVDENFAAFLEELKQEIPLPLDLVDERFSSQLADQLIRSKSRDGQRDAVAAMLILQAYFDASK